MGLFVRDKYERSVKNQASIVEYGDFAISSQEATHEKATCRAHDWRMKSRVRLSISLLSCEKGQLVKDPRKFLFGKMLCFALLSFYLHYIYVNYPQIVRGAFSKRKTLENTLES